jgi:hypothetical protein
LQYRENEETLEDDEDEDSEVMSDEKGEKAKGKTKREVAPKDPEQKKELLSFIAYAMNIE